MWFLSSHFFKTGLKTVSHCANTQLNAAPLFSSPFFSLFFFLFIDSHDITRRIYFLPNVSNTRFACHVVRCLTSLAAPPDSTKYHSTSLAEPPVRRQDLRDDETHSVRGTRRYNTTTFAIGPRSPRRDSHSSEPRHDTSRWRPEEQEAE